MKEHKARKRFGQNFLQNMRTISDIANAVRPQSDGIVIEIGSGLTAIIEPSAEKLNCLHVRRIDHDIIHRLKTSPLADESVIHEDDVLQFDLNSIEGKKKIIDNLPCNISTPLLFRLSEVTDDVIDMHFMLQKEVAECMVAQPKTNDYGRLGAVLQYFFDMEVLTEVLPKPFGPAPKVDSTAVRIVLARHCIGEAEGFEHFAKLVKLAFYQCHKTIRNNLKEFADNNDLQVVGVSPQDRTEHITAEKYVELSNYLIQKAV